MSKGTEMRKSMVLQLSIARVSLDKEETKEMGQIQLMQSLRGYPGNSGNNMQYWKEEKSSKAEMSVKREEQIPRGDMMTAQY